MRRVRGWIVIVIGLMGCTGGGDAPVSVRGPAEDFTDLEARLLDASAVEMDFEVIAEGAVEVAITGRLVISAEGAQSLEAVGTFAGAPADLMLAADAEGIRWGSADDPTEGPALPAVRESLLIGLTRMGILHNLARLTAGAPPDHAEGGAAEWVVVDAFQAAETSGTGDAVAFDITVEGVPSGSAILEVDGDGNPMERRQTVAFPQGEMRVTERYSAVRIGA